ncbi:hypothetical protein [Luedemannella helvata]|uniref:Beta-lactamase n=1 Tax=Luedemannella helvata TaxID=349315 RepID=A0ABN2KJ67_9ACTN
MRWTSWLPRRTSLRIGLALGATVAVAVPVAFAAASDRPAGQRTAPVPPSAEAPVATPSPSARPKASPSPVAKPSVTLDMDGWYSWAIIDRATGREYGSTNRGQTRFSESVIKAGLAAEFLRRADASGEEPPAYRMDQLRRMIRDSSDHMADQIWAAIGQEDGSRAIFRNCRMTDAGVFPDMWSQTYVSARDLSRLADCIADGRAAGPRWTPWLLDEMRNLRGIGDFGIGYAVAADARARVAKNGWFLHADHRWQVNCMAVTDGWALAVLTNYPERHGIRYGGSICQKVAERLLPTMALLRG